MNYSEFQTLLINRLNTFTSPGISVQIQLIEKNNAVDRIGLVLHDEHEPVRKAAPIVYPALLYRSYLAGASMEEIADCAWKILHYPTPAEADGRILEDKDYVLEHAVLRMVGKERNEEVLKDVLFRKFLDFAVTIGIYIRDGEDSCAITVLSREMFDMLDITEEELFQRAEANSVSFFGDQMLDISMMLHFPGEDPEIDPEHLARTDYTQYILTNRYHFYGAGTLLYTDKLRKLSESLNKDLLILPSSIHELILVPDDGTENAARFQMMVENVNRSELRKEEILTDHVYRYSRERKCVEYA